jgi:hypothetical protein
VRNDTQRTASVPDESTNTYMMTHSIYTVLLPTHNAVGLYMKICSRAPGSLEDVWCDS